MVYTGVSCTLNERRDAISIVSLSRNRSRDNFVFFRHGAVVHNTRRLVHRPFPV